MEKRRPSPVKSRRQEARARAERAANRLAAGRGAPLPYPNPWDAVDPTKVPRDASDDEVQRSYEAFRALCPPRPRRKHFL